jgi:maleylacetoacetate isomerase
MIFHGYFRSSAAWRCRIAFNLKGLSPEFRPVHLRRKEQSAPDYTALNPQGLVPTLETGTGSLNQSLAIIEWLEETHPEPPLLPEDAFAKAQVRAFAMNICCDIHPLQNLRVLNYLEERFKSDQAEKDRWCGEWIRAGLDGCEKVARAQSHGGAFVFGDAPGLADLCLIPQMASAARFKVEISDLTRLAEVTAACNAMEAFAAAAPERQPDFE